MSAQASPAPKSLSWAEAVRIALRAVAVQVWSGMVPWRWLLATVVFAVSAFLVEGQLDSSFRNREIHRPVDAWDLFPGLLIDFALVFVLWGFGFLLFIVDSYQRGREQGTLSLALVRIPSRPLYWLGTMGAVGVIALGYVALAFVVSLMVGMIFAPPPDIWPMLPREGELAMYPSWSMSMPVYSLLLVGYTTWALWVIGCAVALLSLFVRRKAVVLAAIVLWNALSMASHDMPVPVEVLRLLNVGFLVGMFKHHMKSPFPMDQFFAATGAALVLMAVVGSWKMRREEP